MLYTYYFLIIHLRRDAVVQGGPYSCLPKLTSWCFDRAAESLSELARVRSRALIAISIDVLFL
jgi:hypothetical protein